MKREQQTEGRLKPPWGSPEQIKQTLNGCITREVKVDVTLTDLETSGNVEIVVTKPNNCRRGKYVGKN